MKHVLVTGGAGYIGSHACKLLAQQGYVPVTFDSLVTGWASAVKFGPFVQGDLLDRAALDVAFAKYEPVAVMHFAALSQVGEATCEPGRYWRNNVLGSLNLVEAMVAADCKQMVFSSTCATYGDQDGVVLDEQSAQMPLNAYGASKRAVEEILRDFGVSHGLEAVVFRYFNVAGADVEAEVGEWHQPETHLIPVMIEAVAGKRDALTIYGTDYPTPDGTCVRDYVHVMDLVDAHIKGLEWLLEGKGSHRACRPAQLWPAQGGRCRGTGFRQPTRGRGIGLVARALNAAAHDRRCLALASNRRLFWVTATYHRNSPKSSTPNFQHKTKFRKHPPNMKPVRKAVFPVAGFGTRFLPATKAMPKELLPIVDKPLIQYAAEEAIAAGIDTLIFVTGRNKRAIEDHFDSNQELEAALRAKGKNEQAQMVRSILPDGVECIFVRQPEQLGLGHAVLCAERAVGDDPFAVLLADDFLTYEGAGVIADLVKGYEASGRTQLSVMEVNGPDISKYGVVQPGTAAGSVAGLVEKPAFEQAPSNLASIGRYVLTPDIFEILRGQAPGAGGEIQLADAINTQAAAGQVEAVTLNGQRFDCGSVKGFLQAIMHVAQRDGLV